MEPDGWWSIFVKIYFVVYNISQFSESANEISVTDLHRECLKVGIEMGRKKTEVIFISSRVQNVYEWIAFNTVVRTESNAFS